jgi:hypothetical protein
MTLNADSGRLLSPLHSHTADAPKPSLIQYACTSIASAAAAPSLAPPTAALTSVPMQVCPDFPDVEAVPCAAAINVLLDVLRTIAPAAAAAAAQQTCHTTAKSQDTSTYSWMYAAP